YDVRLEAAANGRQVAVPFETRTFEEQLERRSQPFATREITYLEIDAFGNILRQRTRVQRAGVAEAGQDVATQVGLATNTETHVPWMPARVTEKDANGVVRSTAIPLYDGPPHAGLPEGEVTSGVVTRQESLAISDALAATVYGANQPDWAILGYHRLPGETG